MLTKNPKSSANPAIAEIERLGFQWYEEAQFDLSRVSKDRRIQVRDADHYSPRANVAQYAVQMREQPFWPIVATSNDWLADGNTRAEAEQLNKSKFTPAIIIEAEYGKNAKTDAKLKALAATLNQQNGERLTTAEIKAVGRELVQNGWKPDEIARTIGLKASAVTQIKRELAAQAKLAKVGFKDADKLSASVMRVLGMDPAIGLNDVPFKAMSELVVDANLQPKEIRELADEMRKVGSDTGQIDLVAQRRGEMEERINDHRIMGNGKPAISSQLRRALGLILKYEDNPSVLVEKADRARDEHLRAIRKAIAVLEAVEREQEEANG